jgi:hypothetical protein
MRSTQSGAVNSRLVKCFTQSSRPVMRPHRAAVNSRTENRVPPEQQLRCAHRAAVNSRLKQYQLSNSPDAAHTELSTTGG